MTLQMHLTIEQRAPKGDWHAIWDTGLQYTEWFDSRYDVESNFATHQTLKSLTPQNDILLKFLSGVRGPSHHSLDGIGTKSGGVLDVGKSQDWPNDISNCAKARRCRDFTFHTYGYATFSRLTNLKAKLSALKDSDNHAMMAERAAFLRWVSILERTVDIFRGENGLLKTILWQIPKTALECHDPDFPIGKIGSGHEMMAVLSGEQWNSLLEGDDNIRILVAYST